jgi:hypothetical protein
VQSSAHHPQTHQKEEREQQDDSDGIQGEADESPRRGEDRSEAFGDDQKGTQDGNEEDDLQQAAQSLA